LKSFVGFIIEPKTIIFYIWYIFWWFNSKTWKKVQDFNLHLTYRLFLIIGIFPKVFRVQNISQINMSLFWQIWKWTQFNFILSMINFFSNSMNTIYKRDFVLNKNKLWIKIYSLKMIKMLSLRIWYEIDSNHMKLFWKNCLYSKL
jgi:hypothetical protein